MTLQTPAPSFPPPGSGPVPEWVAPFLAVLLLIIVGAVLLMPLIRAWARRLEAREVDPAMLDEMAHMRERLAELEASNARLPELEERLDFAERLLANGREPSRERLTP
jgi:hypothetical protein